MPKAFPAGTSAHIERTINPKNADETRTHLNRELIAFSEGISNRTEAIQHRIESANIKRKISKNQSAICSQAQRPNASNRKTPN